ncbi:hypothetical protein SAMN05421839_1216 [Halolactibacillus halophilus]|uniref:Transcriptional regulator, AbiEi antitoxin, Type IV TA system n=1 Tax=Halolactibacillus halophilus TaxID=306540 RepID=A0A1I5QEC4_9BACI|nr:hypothetical protein [Halolactibacillus halophilus]GEM02095.1 hypothetical protein HHA03_16270 [Halolactibacillus halophilus]SFP44635.1 hypothetical protein SAMN05421839_1216 [Halolactibacillus halophilus]
MEQHLIDWLTKHPLFKSQDLKAYLKSERITYMQLKRLLKEAKIQKLPFNLYGILNHDGKLIASVEDIACGVNDDAYIIGLYACRFHGITVCDLDTLMIGVEKAFKSVEIEGVLFKPKQEQKRARLIETKGRRYTDYLDTTLDLIEYMDKWLSLDTFLTALLSARALKAEDLITRLAERNKHILYQKCGFLIEIGHLKVTNQPLCLNTCLKQIGESSRFFSKQAKDSGSYVKKWQMIVPETLVNQYNKID